MQQKPRYPRRKVMAPATFASMTEASMVAIKMATMEMY